jgi:hypothetical protein
MRSASTFVASVLAVILMVIITSTIIAMAPYIAGFFVVLALVWFNTNQKEDA